jgi:hypothetical protein
MLYLIKVEGVMLAKMILRSMRVHSATIYLSVFTTLASNWPRSTFVRLGDGIWIP